MRSAIVWRLSCAAIHPTDIHESVRYPVALYLMVRNKYPRLENDRLSGVFYPFRYAFALFFLDQPCVTMGAHICLRIPGTAKGEIGGPFLRDKVNSFVGVLTMSRTGLIQEMYH